MRKPQPSSQFILNVKHRARFADGVTPVVGLCVAVNRLGCFMHGCCYGVVCRTQWPWCVRFPQGSIPEDHQEWLGLIPLKASQSLPTHPLQLYFAAAALLMSLVTLLLARRRRYDGQVALVGFFFFWATTAALEGLREVYGSSPTWGPFEQLQWVAIGLALVSFIALAGAEIAHWRRTDRMTPASRPLEV